MEINNEIFALTGFAVGIIVQAVKPLKFWNASYSGILALALGALIGFALTFEGGLDYSTGIISGLAGGATAAGVYSTISSAKEADAAAEANADIPAEARGWR